MRRDDFEHVDSFAKEVLGQCGLAFSAGVRDDVEATARNQGREDDSVPQIGRDGRHRCIAHARLEKQRIANALNVINDISVLDTNPFRGPGRAAGVNDVGEIVGMAWARWFRVKGVPVERVECHHLDAGIGWNRVFKVGLRKHQPDAGIGEHKGDTIRREAGVDGHIRSAGLENGKQADDHVHGSLDEEAHKGIGPDTLLPQPMGQLVGPPIQRVIAQPFTLEDHRGRVRGAGDLLLEQFVETDIRVLGRGMAPCIENLFTVSFIQRGLPGVDHQGSRQLVIMDRRQLRFFQLLAS